MLLDVGESDWLYLSGIIYGCLIVIFIIVGIAYLNQGKKKEGDAERSILYSFGGFIIAWGISRFFFIIRNEQVLVDFPVVFEVFRLLMQVWSILASFLMLFFYERVYKRTRYLLSTIPIGIIVLYIIFFGEIGSFIMNNIGPVIFFILELLIVLNITRSSRRELKTLGSILFIGMGVGQLGLAMTNEQLFTNHVVIWVIGPLFATIAAPIFYIPLRVHPERLKQPVKFWAAFGIGLLSACAVLLVYYIVAKVNPVMLAFGIVYIILLIIVVVQAIQDSRVKGTGIAAPGGAPNVLGMFERPKQVTEEEVSISKEKRVCLVCKGPVARYNVYICPECNAMYHQRCAKILEGLENACWACETPFDEEKPVKLSKDEIPKEEGFVVGSKKDAEIVPKGKKI
ncbi:MAG: DC1 domain-containing protein [Candidatus Hodarchaeota archaeon]